MKKPVLVIMAAGMGSRFGGLKQIAPVDDQGHIIIDFSLLDAYRAGFRDLVFIIKPELEESFREAIVDRMEKYFNITFVHQTIDKLPEGYSVPADRVKPWGTGHAILCCKDVLDGPFAVINADDFYGPTAFSAIYDYLANNEDESRYAMIGYRVRNTVTENGSVARGVCEVENGLLTGVTERTKIFKNGADAKFTEDDGKTFTDLPGDTIVSMNLWGFTASFLNEVEARFPAFLDAVLGKNPGKAEFFLPTSVTDLLNENKATVKLLTSPDKWYGVTYAADKPVIVAALKEMTDKGMYPAAGLWSK